jgi:hypothetical protein
VRKRGRRSRYETQVRKRGRRSRYETQVRKRGRDEDVKEIIPH